MTVSTETNKVSYIGNGVATSFAIPFPFLEQEHLKVRQLLNDVQTERTDWTVSNGNIVFATAPEEGAQILIMREVPLTQETDYRDNEILHAETLERNFDKLTMQVQQLAGKSARAVTVDIFDNSEVNADELIPSIRQSESICTEQATTARNKAQEAATSATNAAASETNTAAMLGTKANVDANNFSQNGKKTLFDTIAPDYTAGITQVWDTDYTASKNGYLYCSANSQGGIYGKLLKTIWIRIRR